MLKPRFEAHQPDQQHCLVVVSALLYLPVLQTRPRQTRAFVCVYGGNCWQGCVARTDDSVFVEMGDPLRDDEADRDITADDLDELLLELRKECCRPEPIVEQLRDHRALRIVLVLGDGLRLEGSVAEIARQDEGTIRLHFVSGEAEEGTLGLEIADLQNAIDLRMQTGTGAGQGQLF